MIERRGSTFAGGILLSPPAEKRKVGRPRARTALKGGGGIIPSLSKGCTSKNNPHYHFRKRKKKEESHNTLSTQ